MSQSCCSVSVLDIALTIWYYRSKLLIFCDIGVQHKKQQQKADASEAETTDQEVMPDADDDVSIVELFSLEEELPFCVYDNIENKLVGCGVPAEEIAFIHEAKTETQKSVLFEKVRNHIFATLHGQTTHSAEMSVSTGYIVRGLRDIVNGIGWKL